MPVAGQRNAALHADSVSSPPQPRRGLCAGCSAPCSSARPRTTAKAIQSVPSSAASGDTGGSGVPSIEASHTAAAASAVPPPPPAASPSISFAPPSSSSSASSSAASSAAATRRLPSAGGAAWGAPSRLLPTNSDPLPPLERVAGWAAGGRWPDRSKRRASADPARHTSQATQAEALPCSTSTSPALSCRAGGREQWQRHEGLLCWAARARLWGHWLRCLTGPS